VADTVVWKNSGVAGAVPAPSELQVGELAINTADKKLYTKNAAGEIITIF
jgi:hypothetical protein